MIHLFLGKLGSGKTLHAVRQMYEDQDYIKTYSNIITKKLKNNCLINSDMIIKKVLVDTKRKRDGTEVPVYEYKLNREFWIKLENEPLNVIIDEAHEIFNARRSFSNINKIFSSYLSLLRRVVGNRDGTVYGRLTLISQLSRRLDIIGREMCNSIYYHIGHYIKQCRKCKLTWQENSEIPEPIYKCPQCNHPYLIKYNHVIQVYKFKSLNDFEMWQQTGQKFWYGQIYIKNCEKIFPLYKTMQWDNLFDDLY
ncbi:hypothetical protein LCGC14_0577150 [marine sediment metagenome]|uniref:Zona occludens toxin N-terminal domain-containing protein n=1 Tax=marine sediment metagenome TaxID=412755 RepID=A0A0F9UQU9_9ZZZZ